MEPTKPVKLCTTCKHCAAHPELLKADQTRLHEYNCFHPKNIYGYSPVDGSPLFRQPYCVDLRDESMCTAAGNWWEPKPVETVVAKQIIKAGAKGGTDLLESLGM